MTTFVYRITDPAGELLYVGMSRNLRQRLEQHRSQRRPWADGPHCIHLEPFGSRLDARRAESFAIRAEEPLFNQMRGRFHLPSPNQRVLVLRLGGEEKRALQALAQRERRSMSGQIRVLIAEATKREEQE